MTVSLAEFCEIENGALRSIDLSKLYRPCQAERPEQGVRLVSTRPMPSEAVVWLQRLLMPPRSENMALVPRRQSALIRASSGFLSAKPRQERQADLDVKLQPLEPQTYSVETSNDGGNVGGAKKNSRIGIELPFGMPRFVNAQTLKAMLGASRSDRLFRKAGAGWIVCPDSFRIDVMDQREVFRLGKIQVLS